MITRFAGSDGLGAIFPPMVWSIVALKASGYADDSPEMKYCVERLEGLIIEERTTAGATVQVADLGRRSPCEPCPTAASRPSIPTCVAA